MIEVLEQLENPGTALQKLSQMLPDDGHVLVIASNLRWIAARAKFLVIGKLRHFHDLGDPTHIYPNLNKLLTRSGLSIVEQRGYPADGALLGTRQWLNTPLRLPRAVLPEEVPGDLLCILAGKS